MTTGWLSVVTQDDDGNQIILSDRVAAVVISPGAPNGGQSRPDEDILNSGTGANLASLPAIAVAQNYLEGENADGDDIFFAYGQHPISLQIGERADSGANPTRRSEDHLEYITIDELAAAFAQSEQAPDYQNDIAELLEGYYNRVGNYPDPAVFHRKSGGEKLRPAGTPATSPETIAGEQVLIRNATGADNVMSIALRVADLPPVYLAPGWRFPDRAGNFDDETTFPFNESLAKMNTRFSDDPLEGIAGANNYESLYENNDHAVATNDLYGLSALEIAEAASETTAPVFNFIARAPELLAAPGENLRVILAAPLAINSTAAAAAQFPNDDSTPPDGADIILPAGTELEIAVGDQTYAQFPSGLQIRGRRYRSTIDAEAPTPEELERLCDSGCGEGEYYSSGSCVPREVDNCGEGHSPVAGTTRCESDSELEFWDWCAANNGNPRHLILRHRSRMLCSRRRPGPLRPVCVQVDHRRLKSQTRLSKREQLQRVRWRSDIQPCDSLLRLSGCRNSGSGVDRTNIVARAIN